MPRSKGSCGVPPEKRIQPGQTRNAKGSSARARFGASLKRLMAGRMVTADSFAQMVAAAVSGTPKDLEDLYNLPDAPMDFKIVAKGLERSLRAGDLKPLLELMGYVIGKPKEHRTLEHSGPEGGPIRTTQAMSEEEILAELAAIRARRAR